MGSQVEEIVLLVLSLAVCSILFGTIFLVIKGWIDGYMKAWEEQHLTNKILPGEVDNEWEDDPDVMVFLEHADEQGSWSEEDDKIYTVGGLTADKDRDFMKFQDKMNERDKQLGGDSDNNVDDEKEE
mgnify:FL=1